MTKLASVIQFEVARAVKKPRFWYATFAPLIIILVILGIEYSSNHVASQSTSAQVESITENTKIALLDDSGLVDMSLVTHSILLEPNKDAGVTAVKKGLIDAFIYYPSNTAQAGIEIFAQDKGISLTPPYDSFAVGLLHQSAVKSLQKTTSDSQAVQILERDPTVNTNTYKNGQPSNSLANIIAPGLFLITLLTLVILLAYNMVGSTLEEKENRVAEVLLTSIRAETLIIGKILAIFVLALVQLVTIVVPLLIVYTLFKGHLTLPGGISLSQIPLDPKAITFGALFFLGGFSLFTSFLVGLGALFPSSTDANRFAGLGIIWVYIPIYTISLIITTPQAFIVNVFSYFPLTIPTTALLLNAEGSLPVWHALLSLAILLLGAGIAAVFAVRAFRYGALEHGRRVSLRDLLK